MLSLCHEHTHLQAAFNLSYRFPNAIYIDALATGGHVRTGLRRLSDQPPPPGNHSSSSGNNSGSSSSSSDSASRTYTSSGTNGSGSGPICALFQWTPCLSNSEAEALGNGGCSSWVRLDDDYVGEDVDGISSSSVIRSRSSDSGNSRIPRSNNITTTTTPNGDQSPWEVFDSSGQEQGACNQSQTKEAPAFASTSSLSSSLDAPLSASLPTKFHRRCCRNADSTHASDSFAYADLLIAATARQGCAILASETAAAAATTAGVDAGAGASRSSSRSSASSNGNDDDSSSGNDNNDDNAALAACSNVAAQAAARYWKHPVNLWDDPQTGRIAAWPEGWFDNGPPPKEDTFDFLEPSGST
jgi:hypothetical protein